jgi:hypothetical protein
MYNLRRLSLHHLTSLALYLSTFVVLFRSLYSTLFIISPLALPPSFMNPLFNHLLSLQPFLLFSAGAVRSNKQDRESRLQSRAYPFK